MERSDSSGSTIFQVARIGKAAALTMKKAAKGAVQILNTITDTNALVDLVTDESVRRPVVDEWLKSEALRPEPSKGSGGSHRYFHPRRARHPITMNIDETIRAIQKKLNLQVDGHAGPNTWAAIYKAIFPTKPIPETLQPAASPIPVADQVDPRSEKVIARLQPEVPPYARGLGR